MVGCGSDGWIEEVLLNNESSEQLIKKSSERELVHFDLCELNFEPLEQSVNIGQHCQMSYVPMQTQNHVKMNKSKK